MTRSRRIALIAAAVLCAGAAVVLTSYRKDLRSAEQRLARVSRSAITPCGRIEYAIEGEGPPILVVHGAGGGYDQGLTLAADLVQKGYRLIAVSRFGYLNTPLPVDASAAAQADAHACLLDALGLKRVAVLGASAGAPSSLQLAIRHPERVSALILLVPAAYMPGAQGAGASPPPGLDFIFNTALKWDLPFWLASHVARSAMIRTMLATPPELVRGAEPQERAQAYEMLDQILPVSARRLGLVNDAKVTSTLPRYPLEHISAPTLAVSAEDDGYGTFERARYTASQIPGARFIGFPTGGHLLVGRQAATTAAIVELLSRAQGAARTP